MYYTARMSGLEEKKQEQPKAPVPDKKDPGVPDEVLHNTASATPEADNTEIRREQPATIRESLGRAAEGMQGVANVFRRRIEQNLYPLLERDDVRKIFAGANALTALSPKSADDYRQTADALRQMSSGLEKFGTYNSRLVKENSESLRGVAALTKAAEISVRDLMKALAREDEPASAEATQAAVRLASILEDIQGRVLRAA